MGWHTRGKIALHGFHSLASRVVLQDSIFQRTSRICQCRYLNWGSKGASFDVFSSFSSISHRLGTRGVEVNKNFRNPFLAGASRRFYYKHGVRHFRPRGPRRWFHNPRNVRNAFIVLVVVSGVFITVDFGSNLETVPYTNRTRNILPTIARERIGGEELFEELKVAFEREGKVLPPTHPDSVRVIIILNNIIDALQRGLKKMENVSSSKHNMLHRIIPMRLLGISKPKPSTLHLDGLNWEVLVVDYPGILGRSFPGKIVVSTGLLHHFGSDVEIATVIGHEVAHVVARHDAEKLTRTLWIFVINYMLNQFVTTDFAKTIVPRLPFNRRFEMEADYIGLLLMASAGFDPQPVPKIYEKMGKFEVTDNDSMLGGYLSTHPPIRKRAKALARAKIMKEALSLYKDVRAERGVE